MIEMKEDLELTKPRETKVEISYQNFFRKYFTLSGMTGTCFEVKKELRDVFRVSVSMFLLIEN
jgi:preprotein translocase subunit SecA